MLIVAERKRAPLESSVRGTDRAPGKMKGAPHLSALHLRCPNLSVRGQFRMQRLLQLALDFL
jgi:hypothetical protein